MSFFYSLPDDAVFSGTGFLRSQQDQSLGYPVEVSWLVRKHLFTFRMPWVDFSDDDIDLGTGTKDSNTAGITHS